MGQTTPPVSPNSQPLNQSVSVTSDLTGAATFTFQSTPTGFIWTGTIVCSNAPATANFTAMIGATPWGSWGGSSVSGAFQSRENQQLAVTATGLAPLTDYLLVWTGASDSGPVEPIWPDTATQAQQVVLPQGLRLASSTLGAPGPGSFTVPPNIRTLVFLMQTASPTTVTGLAVQGLQTGLEYYNQALYLPVSSGVILGQNLQIAVVPIVAVIDTSFGFSFGTSPILQQVTTTVLGDAAGYDESMFYNGPILEASHSGATVGTTLVTGPCRLLTAYGNCATGGPAVTINVNGTAVLVTQGGPVGLTFPDDTIVQSGQAVQVVIATGGQGGVTYAYP
jgi:hypothetical protein